MAAADYALGDTDEPPPVLQMAWRCERWGALPEAGGILDQPLKLMVQMETTLNVFNVYDEYNRIENTPDWEKRRPRAAKLYRQIEKMRRGDG